MPVSVAPASGAVPRPGPGRRAAHRLVTTWVRQLPYPARGDATLWAPPPQPDTGALARQLGPARADLLRPLAEPTATVELARRLRVTPSAVSQHLQVLHASGLVTRARAGRQVLYRRSPLGDQLSDGVTAPLRP